MKMNFTVSTSSRIKTMALTALFFLMLSGCSLMGLRSSTRFRNEDIKLGVSKAFILEKYGKPFKEELYTEDGDTIEVLCYKEGLYAHRNEHMVSTFFVFRNGELIKKEQTEELVKNNND